MRMMKYFFLVILVLLLMAPKSGHAAKESAEEEKAEATAGTVDEGRGEGFREEAETGKEGVECPATFGPIITDTAVPIEKGKFAIQPTFGYTFVNNIFTRSWRRISAGGDYQLLKLPVKFTYGLMDNLEIYSVIPFIHNSASKVNEPGPNGNTASSFSGLGDINLTFKYRLVEETQQLPTVSAIFSTNFPTGHFNNLNRDRLGQTYWEPDITDSLLGLIFPSVWSHSSFVRTSGTRWGPPSTLMELMKMDSVLTGDFIPGTPSPLTWPRNMFSPRNGWDFLKSTAAGTVAGFSAINRISRRRRSLASCQPSNTWPPINYPLPWGQA